MADVLGAALLLISIVFIAFIAWMSYCASKQDME